MEVMLRIVAALGLFALVHGHGILTEPPSRSSMWRFGFSNPQNNNDNATNCGGYDKLHGENEGRCGACGDPFSEPTPRDNENGGKYGNGIVVREYVRGQEIPVTVDITTFHGGYFTFSLCNCSRDSNRCFRKFHNLRTNKGRRYILDKDGTTGQIHLRVRLPPNLTCDRCTFRWNWVGGDKKGECKDGSTSLGCGPQGIYRACADIAIQ